MTPDTDITPLAPNQALANISRDELVNLIVDDFMERSAAAEKEANKRANALDEAAKHQRYFSEITEAQNPEKLRRKALATLTREALSQGGVTLQGGLPTMPLALPLAP